MAPPAGHIRPARYLAAFLGIVVLLYALVFFTGDRRPKPKLGIDLEGGTRVTLTARTDNGRPPTREQLTLARGILDLRVNGLGIGGTQVVQDGANLIITVPGDDGEKAKDLAQPAQLRLRTVIGGPFAAAPPPGESPSKPPRPGAPGPGSSAPHAAATRLDGPHAAPSPHPPPPNPADPTQAVADPRLVKDIAQARTTRQSTDPNIQQRAVQNLRCGGNDVLRGYDDSARPLVTCDQNGTEKYILSPVFLEGTEIDSAIAGYDDKAASNIINVTFKSNGARIWSDYTTAHVGKQAAFVLDSEVVSAPVIDGPINGPTEVRGRFSRAEAQHLAGILKFGALPLSFATSDAQTVSATLGLASLEAGLLAGAIGLALVFVYCLFYYRALGVLTILSLVLSAVLVYAVLVLLGRSVGFSLDLAGVAGFIVAIGITADSFVIFFERLKDEVREGRGFKAAVPRAWVRARRTILSADAVMFLAAAVLYLLAVGQVKGFAFTLGMSTILDLTVVFLVTHPLVAMAGDSRVFSSPRWSGLGAVARIGVARRRRLAAARKSA
ncbi:protein translocase subunit SecD [Pseudonocardia spinosispora]|uniref:protein translocase subunit SecD n=1 Tax=Pseudonocardia spinosispora TaxID=103441 RepID=UPI00041B22C0|nr:protein translocase subunit SecD [Pseudonocardia spinosispora]